MRLHQGPNCQNYYYSEFTLFNNHYLWNLRIFKNKSDWEYKLSNER